MGRGGITYVMALRAPSQTAPEHPVDAGCNPGERRLPMEQLKFNFPIPDGYVVKFVAYITVKGKRLYAKAYGKRAWPILVKA